MTRTGFKPDHEVYVREICDLAKDVSCVAEVIFKEIKEASEDTEVPSYFVEKVKILAEQHPHCNKDYRDYLTKLYKKNHLDPTAIHHLVAVISENDFKEILSFSLANPQTPGVKTLLEPLTKEAVEKFPQFGPLVAHTLLIIHKDRLYRYPPHLIQHLTKEQGIDLIDGIRSCGKFNARCEKILQVLFNCEMFVQEDETRLLMRKAYLEKPDLFGQVAKQFANEGDVEYILERLSRKMLGDQNGNLDENLAQQVKHWTEASKEKFPELSVFSVLLDLFRRWPQRFLDDLLEAAREGEIHEIVDVIETQSARQRDWGETVLFVTRLIDFCRENQFRERISSLENFIMHKFGEEPASYLGLLTSYCQPSKILDVAQNLETILVGLNNSDTACTVLGYYLDYANNVQDEALTKVLLRSTAEICLSGPKFEVNQVVSVMKRLADMKADLPFEKILLRSRSKLLRDSALSETLMPFVRAMSEQCVATRTFRDLVIHFVNNEVIQFMNRRLQEQRSAPQNYSLDASKLQQCNNGCNGCNLLKAFLVDPNKRQENITVNQQMRNCIRR